MPKTPLSVLVETLPQLGWVESLAIRPARKAPLIPIETMEISVEAGIQGDHYHATNKKRQVTLIQGEHLDVVGSVLGKSIDPLLTRRNIVVRGINLLSLKDRQFSIGDVVLETTAMCYPCSRMEENLGPGGYNAMRGHGGICAKVIRGGRVKIGDTLRMLKSAK